MPTSVTAVDPRIAIYEPAFAAACEKARADGVALIQHSFDVGNGVCAWGALDRFGDDPALDLADDEYDAIEEGWDSYMSPGAMRTSKPLPWWALGRRLALRFGPVPMSTLEAR